MKSYGAVFALPNIRGGSEFGEEWHNAGIRERKVGQYLYRRRVLLTILIQINVFDDFIAATYVSLFSTNNVLSVLPLPCSEYLVKNKIAAAGKIAINGGSNGGK